MASSSQLELLLHDVGLIVRGIAGFVAQFKGYHLAGIPADWIMHFLVAAGAFALAARFASRRKAAILSLGIIALKEVIDVPVKLSLIRKEPMAVTTDSAIDVAAGLLGLAVAYLLVRKLGDRWRAAEPAVHVEPLPACPQDELSSVLSKVALVCGLAAGVAIVVVFGIGGSFLPHLVAAMLAVGMYVLLGPSAALLLLMPALPFADWLHRLVARDDLHVSTTLILTLFACEAIRRLKRGRRIRLAWPGRILALYAAWASAVVIMNCFRLGWTLDRLYWLIPPLTGLAVYILAGELLADPARLRRALNIFAVGFLVITVVAIVEFIAEPLRLEVVPGSALGSATALSPYLTLVWPLLLALALTAGSARRLICWPAVATGAVVIGLVYVRSGWAAAAVAVMLLAVIVAFRRDWALGVAAVLIIVVSTTALAWSFRHTERRGKPKLRCMREIASVFNPRGYQSARGKEVDAGVQLVERSPILGETGQLVNSLPVAHALTYGVPGTALAALSILSILAYGWMGALRSGNRLLLGVVTGASAGIVAAAFHGLAWSTLLGTSLQPFVWYTLGLVAAAVRAARTGNDAIKEEVGG